MQILDGKEVKRIKLEELKNEVLKLDRPLGLTVIQVGDDSASNIYVKQKSKMASNLGFNFNHIKLEEDVREEEILKIIDDLNRDNNVDGILVPGGFGDRGVEGKIEAIKYARENNIPFLGICLGMQPAVIEFARNVIGYEGANSSEIDSETKYPVIDLMNDQKDVQDLGGTMRLGAYPCILNKESKSFEVYGEENISERHRHRYEFNNKFRQQISEAGMKIVGTSPDERLVEIVEIPNHKWFVAAQFHPELKSRPNRPHPLFTGLIKAALEK